MTRLPLRSVLLLGFLAIASSGCELGNSFFHMDSNSPSPFFGFDLIPRRKTTSLAPPRDSDSFRLAGGIEQYDESTAVRVH